MDYYLSLSSLSIINTVLLLFFFLTSCIIYKWEKGFTKDSEVKHTHTREFFRRKLID